MALSRVKTWTSEVLTATDLNAEFNNILNYLNGSNVTFDGTVTSAAFIPSGSSVPANGMYLLVANNLAWATSGVFGMRLASNGNLSLPRNGYSATYNGLTFNGVDLTDTDSTVGNAFGLFRKADGTPIGSITRAGASSVAYNTTSDYRLKDNVTPITNACARVRAMNPVTFDWVDGGLASEGYIAHELQAIIPAAVTGKKDEVYADGSPKYQSIDYGKPTPVLTAAIQEILDRLDAAGIP